MRGKKKTIRKSDSQKVGKTDALKSREASRLAFSWKGRRIPQDLIQKAEKERRKNISKAARTYVQSFYFENTRGIIREPPWDYEALFEIGKTSWTMQMIYSAIRREALRPAFRIEPKFFKKCTKCGKEYDKVVDACTVPSCRSPVRDPDETERTKLQQFYDKPNPDYGWRELFSSCIFHLVNCGIFWWSVSYRKMTLPHPETQEPTEIKIPSAIYVEDPRYMRFVADGKGRIGGDEWFCPACTSPEYHMDLPNLKRDETPTCPYCNSPLERTCFVQQIGSEVTARFARDEIIYYSPDQVLPELYPTPRPVSLWDLLLTIGFMDDHNAEVYEKGGLESLVNFEGYESEGEIKALRAQIDSEVGKHFHVDPVTGRDRPSRIGRNMFFGSKGKAEVFPLGIDPSRMQSLDFWKTYREAVASVYGVTPVFVGIVESGKSGNNPRMQIDVENRTTEETHGNFEGPLNNKLLSILGVKDWRLMFERPDPRDDLRDQRVQQLRAQTALTWLTAGFTVVLDENEDIVVSGSGSKPPSQGFQVSTPGGQRPPEEELPEDQEERDYLEESERLGIWKMPVPIPSVAGGKRRQVTMLKEQVPKHDLYVEPFAGGAALFFALDGPKKAVLNDINPRFTKLWKWIKEATPAQISAMKARKWTATKEERLYIKDKYEPENFQEEVWQIIYVTRHSFMNRGTTWRGEEREHVYRNRMPTWLNRVDQYRKHLAQATVEQRDWKECVKAHDGPSTFFYIDPPYEDKFVEDLLAILPKLRGKWMLSFSHNKQLIEGLRKAGAQTRKLVAVNMIAKPGGEIRTTREELLAANYPLSVEDGHVVKMDGGE